MTRPNSTHSQVFSDYKFFPAPAKRGNGFSPTHSYIRVCLYSLGTGATDSAYMKWTLCVLWVKERHGRRGTAQLCSLQHAHRTMFQHLHPTRQLTCCHTHTHTHTAAQTQHLAATDGEIAIKDRKRKTQKRGSHRNAETGMNINGSFCEAGE